MTISGSVAFSELAEALLNKFIHFVDAGLVGDDGMRLLLQFL